jgi:hypothetical protein
MFDPVQALTVAATGVLVMAASWLWFYKDPGTNHRAIQRRRVIVCHHMRAKAIFGATRGWPALFPLSVVCLLTALGAVALRSDSPILVAVGVLLFVGDLVAIAISVLMVVRPPDRWLPEWYRDELRRQELGLPPAYPPPEIGAVPLMTRRQRTIVLFALLAVGVAAWIFQWPLALVAAGLGAGFTYLAATRTRESQ